MDWRDDWGWTPVHCAAANGNHFAVEELAAMGADLEVAAAPAASLARMRAWVVVCPPAGLTVCLSLCLSVCLPACLSVCARPHGRPINQSINQTNK